MIRRRAMRKPCGSISQSQFVRSTNGFSTRLDTPGVPDSSLEPFSPVVFILPRPTPSVGLKTSVAL